MKYLFDVDFWKKSAAMKQVKDEKNLASEQSEKDEPIEQHGDVAKKPIFKISQ